MISSKGLKILVVEDDESVTDTLVDILELNGFTAVTARNGAEGLELARREAPALVLSDIAMPGMTGYELLERMRGDDALRSIPVIVISAKMGRLDMRRGMELGAEDFITKPFSEDEVVRSVRARLEKKGLLDELEAFAHTVAHDLKTPLAQMLCRAELLQHSWDRSGDAQKRRNLNEVIADGRRMAGIIEELLVLAGVRRQSVKPTPLDMAPIVEQALKRLELVIAQTGARVSMPQVWPVACGYGPWIVEVWANLVSNAIKYGGAAPVVGLGFENSPSSSLVRFWVQDSGPGIKEEDRALLFVPFTRISGSPAEGHGLGLSIVSRIAEKLGGKVGFDRLAKVGSRFWFELPKEPPAPRS